MRGPILTLRVKVDDKYIKLTYNGEFDPGSGRTLAACLTHASQGERFLRKTIKLADGLVTRRQPTLVTGITQ